MGGWAECASASQKRCFCTYKNHCSSKYTRFPNALFIKLLSKFSLFDNLIESKALPKLTFSNFFWDWPFKAINVAKLFPTCMNQLKLINYNLTDSIQHVILLIFYFYRKKWPSCVPKNWRRKGEVQMQLCGSCGPPSGSHPEASDSDSRAQINRPLNLAVTCFVLISEISRNLPLMFVHDSWTTTIAQLYRHYFMSGPEEKRGRWERNVKFKVGLFQF